MATPTPVTYTQWDGTRGITYWRAEWTTTDNFTDTVVVDISALSPVPTAIKIRAVKATLNGDIEATIELDATTDVLVYVFEGQTDSTLIDITDFTDGPSNGRVASSSLAGFVGDAILTTANVASGDELTLLVYYQKSE